ncbi:MAG: hypothetical protein JWL73_2923 [Actinomycetia bacterium]|nr:hypothetical protein [Actinomycetes bacterium]
MQGARYRRSVPSREGTVAPQPPGQPPSRGPRPGRQNAKQRIRQRRKLAHPWRWAITLITALLCVNLLVYVGVSARTNEDNSTEQSKPSEVQSVLPAPGDLERVQVTVSVDLRDDLTGSLVIDGTNIPDDQVDRVPALGQLSFRPGPGKEFERLEPGSHTVTVNYHLQQSANRDRGTYSWSFTTG